MNRQHLEQKTRRHFFADCGVGVGKIALASLLADRGLSSVGHAASTTPFTPKPTHYAPRAKRVIYLSMIGAPSQLDLFDNKPKLRELDGKPIPPSVIKGQRYAFIQPDAAVLAPRFKFQKHGQSGLELSEVLPHLGSVADDIAVVRSLHTDQFNHSPAQLFFNTGSPIPGRPAMGSWLSYGIGSESNNLPSFVVLKSGGNLSGGAAMWSSGFLPSSHQGVPFRSQGDPILHVSNPAGFDNRAQRESLDLIRDLNLVNHKTVGDPEITTRISAYERAYSTQAPAPDPTHSPQEPNATRDL